MLLDTGADVTIVPGHLLIELGIAPDTENVYETVGYDGAIHREAAVRLEILFLGPTFKGLFLVVDMAWGIIGRNLLSKFAILLDGPGQQWSEQRQ